MAFFHIHLSAPISEILWLSAFSIILFICIMVGWIKKRAILFTGDFADTAQESKNKGAFWFFMVIDHIAFIFVMWLLYKDLF